MMKPKMEKKKKDKIEKIRCPVCKSTMVYFRLKTHELVCRTCNHIEKMVV